MLNGSACVRVFNRWEITTWNISPARIYSLQRSTALRKSAFSKFDEKGILISPFDVISSLKDITGVRSFSITDAIFRTDGIEALFGTSPPTRALKTTFMVFV